MLIALIIDVILWLISLGSTQALEQAHAVVQAHVQPSLVIFWAASVQLCASLVSRLH